MSELTREQIENYMALPSTSWKAAIPRDKFIALCQMALQAAALSAEGMVRVPEFTFNEIIEYLEAREDVQDGDDGRPKPNEEMRLATDLRNLLATQGGGRE